MPQTFRWLVMRHFEKTEHPLGTHIPHPLIARPYVSLWNLLDRAVVRLSEEGREHAVRTRHALSQYLAHEDIRPAYAFVSPYQRTRESFEEVRAALPLGLEVVYDRRLGELDAGVRCGGDFNEMCRRYPQYGSSVAQKGFLDTAAPWGESHASRRDGLARDFVGNLKGLNSDCLIVTHCGVIDCLHQLASKIPDSEVVARLTDPNRTGCGSLLDLRYEPADDTLTVVRENLTLQAS